MKCPSCGAPAGDDALECPACGLLFAKWREKVERERLAAEALLALGKPVGEPPSRRTTIIISGAFVLFWTSLLGWWYARHPARVPVRSAAEKIGKSVELRDPETGELRRLRIERAGGPPPVAPGAAAGPKEPKEISEAEWTETVSTAPAR